MRKDPTLRKEYILLAALSLALDNTKLTRDNIAKEAGISPGLVTHYFGDMDIIRAEMLRAAVRLELLPLLAQYMVSGKLPKLPLPLTVRIREYVTHAKL